MMKAITWLASMSVGIAVLAPSAFATAPQGWLTDVEAAIAQAKEENKSVMVSFVGSDWCPPCIMMSQNVFTKQEFFDQASENFILVHIDLPNGDPALREKNLPTARKYGVEGFPMIVLFDSEGKEFTRFMSARYPAVEALILHLEKSLEKKDFD